MTKWNVLSKWLHHQRAWFLLASVFVVMVSAIQNRFGWNQFHLVDLDSGVRAMKARFQLETLPFVDVSMDDSFTAEGDGVEYAVAPTSAETAEDRSAKPTVNRKWRNRSDADLTYLQEMRHSKSTSQQTRWAAKIFRGESDIFLKCRHWIIIDLGGIRQYFSRKTSKHYENIKTSRNRPSILVPVQTLCFPNIPKERFVAIGGSAVIRQRYDWM